MFDSLFRFCHSARAANAGALPPDLSVITKARHGGADYVFALLTGYRTAPKGLEVPGGLYYNPYFPGGGIAMAQKLFDDAVEYDDGTPQTQSQYAKDVSEFLAWLGEPELEDRKRTGFKFLAVMTLLLFPALYVKRFKYSTLKTRVVKFVEPKNWKN
jgi:ubiquinol-cytochrome c reductase cytochrome c1 subunit